MQRRANRAVGLFVMLCAAIVYAAAIPLATARAATGWTSSPQGAWVETYGASGYSLGAWNGSNDLTSIPGGTVTLVTGSRWVWAKSTTDARALQSPTAQARRRRPGMASTS